MKTLTTVVALALPVAGLAAEARFTGTAKPVGGGDVIYKETHTITGECQSGIFRPREHTVVYRRGDTEPFATKDLDYSQSALRPTVDFQQPDFSERMEIANPNDELISIDWQTPTGKTKSFTVDVHEDLVADSGFDNFVRQNWAEVVERGNSVDFDILAPTRGDYYGFTLEPNDDERIDAPYQVKILPSGTLMGFLVDPILLGYNSDGMLTDYLGLSNIRKNEDTNYITHIRYSIEAAPECALTQ
ncbi:hypothetical protein [Marinobacter sp. CHS3-4]|uniref:hypothetical protein n=1 Tax=Marinobacter sp. CHS3-4 TaxID=3045174 RepID=UPI0024B5CE4D|nr:hypothetical protein [Marinobacter sp. CHS3-4]MDI9245449.1 hypothetical protein [Marinobacter sp. CHS3-4]